MNNLFGDNYKHLLNKSQNIVEEEKLIQDNPHAALSMFSEEKENEFREILENARKNKAKTQNNSPKRQQQDKYFVPAKPSSLI